MAVAGIGKNKLNSALTDVSNGGDGMVKSGRPSVMTDAILQAVNAEVTKLSMNFQSVRAQDGGEYTIWKLFEKEIKNSRPNSIAELEAFDAKTKKKWLTIATLCIEVEGEMLRYYLFRSHLCPCHRYYPRNYLPPFNTGVSLSATIKTGTI